MIGVDRDPEALERAAGWAGGFGDRLDLRAGTLRRARPHRGEAGRRLDGVVLDIGVSSMQIDQAARGFSFLKDGPLDMRMEQAGPSAADLVNGAPEALLADILLQYGEERAARRIARAIVAARKREPFATTLELAAVIERCLPRPKPGQPHAATRSFQALRIAVNDELGELARGLAAAEAALAPGRLAGGRDLSFARGPHREAIPAAALRRRRRARAAMRPRRRPRRRRSRWRRARRSSRTRPRSRSTRGRARRSCGSRAGWTRRRGGSIRRCSGCRRWRGSGGPA